MSCLNSNILLLLLLLHKRKYLLSFWNERFFNWNKNCCRLISRLLAGIDAATIRQNGKFDLLLLLLMLNYSSQLASKHHEMEKSEPSESIIS